MNLKRSLATLVFGLLLLHPGIAFGQSGGSAEQSFASPFIGSVADDLIRAGQLEGQSADGYLLRSFSNQLGQGNGTGFRLRVLPPRLDATWNSDIPISLNEGTGWSGRGANAIVTGGFIVKVGPLSAVVAPEFAYSENLDFAIVPQEIPSRSDYAMGWFADTLSIDMPVRFGADERRKVSLGQSSVHLSAGPVAVGASTENHWWGPGIRNAIVLSNNASGFPHAFARTTRPLRTAIGELEWVWIAGVLSGSEYFDSTAPDSSRNISGFAITYSPHWQPNLYVGAARTVYSARSPSDGALPAADDVFLDWSGSNELERNSREDPSEQIFSLFGRWLFPSDGLELYGEWARYRLPLSLRDLLEQPNHSQGYTLGMQWLKPLGATADLRLQAELTNLERSSTYRLRPIGSFYTSLALPHGYTHEGKVLGAGIGPGSSSQWAAADLIAGNFRIGAYATRIRWNNDAYYRRTAPWPFFGHDVSLIAGLRGGLDWRHLRIDLDLAQGKRHNFLFQNWGAGWENMEDAVDVSNRSLTLRVTPLL